MEFCCANKEIYGNIQLCAHNWNVNKGWSFYWFLFENLYKLKICFGRVTTQFEPYLLKTVDTVTRIISETHAKNDQIKTSFTKRRQFEADVPRTPTRSVLVFHICNRSLEIKTSNRFEYLTGTSTYSPSWYCGRYLNSLIGIKYSTIYVPFVPSDIIREILFIINRNFILLKN